MFSTNILSLTSNLSNISFLYNSPSLKWRGVMDFMETNHRNPSIVRIGGGVLPPLAEGPELIE